MGLEFERYSNFKRSLKIENPASSQRISPQQQRAATRLASILDAAERVLAQRGYAALTTRAIAADAEITQTSMYHYFADKQSIVRALVDRFADHWHSRLDALKHCPSLDTALTKLLDELFGACQTQPWIGQGFVALKSDPKLANYDADINKKFADDFAMLLAHFKISANKRQRTVRARILVTLIDAFLMETARKPGALSLELRKEFALLMSQYANH